ncbi:MAG TPA: NAD(P)-dependent alcohol dehydrogenase [Chlamydiales bacterium]|nr:NAD(P)-dependent alcohol dehydrogenase [Chlamydiales bacterium]
MKTLAFAAYSATTPLKPFHFERRQLGEHDVDIEIIYCGICHSDVHMARNEWGGATVYPIVPGHEIVGRVKRVGSKVRLFKEGDLAAVGCLVDSCRACPSCKDHLEQYCEKGRTLTYNSPEPQTGKVTYGGYSTQIIVDENYVLHVPKKFKESQLPGVAPLVCAGITTYSPLRYWKVGKGSVVGIVGLGGLGHMAVKLARAMGAHVAVFTTSANKTRDALKLGAHEVILSTNTDEMQKHQNRFDFILDTVSSSHEMDDYVLLLKRDATLCLVGVPEDDHPSLTIDHLIFKRKKLAGSLIGGIRETQEVLDFCAEHNITAEVEVIPMEKINEAYERMLKRDVKYRFVIDIKNSHFH